MRSGVLSQHRHARLRQLGRCVGSTGRVGCLHGNRQKAVQAFKCNEWLWSATRAVSAKGILECWLFSPRESGAALLVPAYLVLTFNVVVHGLIE
eukprot:5136083-Pleurochrysis_carterae.AAC.1